MVGRPDSLRCDDGVGCFFRCPLAAQDVAFGADDCGVVAHRSTVECQHRVEVGDRGRFIPVIAIVTANVVLGTIAIVQMGGVDGKLLIAFAGDQAVDTAAVVVEGIDGGAVGDGVAA